MIKLKKIPTMGDRGEDVLTLQAALVLKGYSLDLDGIFGINTFRAVCGYQSEIGLPRSGILEDKTLAALGMEILLTEVQTSTPSPGLTSTLGRKLIATTITDIIKADIRAGLRETNGKNRSPRIDSFNERCGVPMGSPYCASGGWCAIDDACKMLGLKNPVKASASSQAYGKPSFVPAKYLRKSGSLGMLGDVGVLQTVGDKSRGHYVTVGKDQEDKFLFSTLEYNTDGSGSRDGDGAYAMVRSTKNPSSVNSKKIFICFTDIPQWILDSNS